MLLELLVGIALIAFGVIGLTIYFLGEDKEE